MKKNSAAERRQYKRLRAYHLAKYKLLNNPEIKAAAILTSIKDISGGGACLRTKEILPNGTFIQLFINFPHIPEPISCVAKIVWIKKIEYPPAFELGLEFVELKDLLRHEIIKRIDYTIKKVEPRK